MVLSEAETALRATGLASGLTPAETEATLRSGLAAGLQHPRGAPPRADAGRPPAAPGDEDAEDADDCEPAESAAPEAFPEKLLSGLPPFLSGLVAWACSAVEVPNPPFALAGALATTAALAGRRYRLGRTYPACIA